MSDTLTMKREAVGSLHKFSLFRDMGDGYTLPLASCSIRHTKDTCTGWLGVECAVGETVVCRLEKIN